ncbi:MAG: hypothetical protein SVU32_07860 [Candidatus Nanohaloarchaea archaeon]|nr:hypothetical protein [Candidatus Nanohaloarchaea archaeon]
MTASTHTHEYDTIEANPGMLQDDVTAKEAHRYFEDITEAVDKTLSDRSFDEYTMDVTSSYVSWTDEDDNRHSTEGWWEVSNFEELGYDPSIGRHEIVAEDEESGDRVEVSATYYAHSGRVEVDVEGTDPSVTVDVGETLEGTLDDSLLGWF